MGSYSSITFDGYPILEIKNRYYKEIVSLLFQPEDFIVERRTKSSLNPLVWGENNEDEGNYEFIGYKQTVNICRNRLRIFGNSLRSAEKDFKWSEPGIAFRISFIKSNYTELSEKDAGESSGETLKSLLNT